MSLPGLSFGGGGAGPSAAGGGPISVVGGGSKSWVPWVVIGVVVLVLFLKRKN